VVGHLHLRQGHGRARENGATGCYRLAARTDCAQPRQRQFSRRVQRGLGQGRVNGGAQRTVAWNHQHALTDRASRRAKPIRERHHTGRCTHLNLRRMHTREMSDRRPLVVASEIGPKQLKARQAYQRRLQKSPACSFFLNSEHCAHDIRALGPEARTTCSQFLTLALSSCGSVSRPEGGCMSCLR
jgi:hypothetical protein